MFNKAINSPFSADGKTCLHFDILREPWTVTHFEFNSKYNMVQCYMKCYNRRFYIPNMIHAISFENLMTTLHMLHFGITIFRFIVCHVHLIS